MPAVKPSPKDRIALSFNKLTAASDELNAAVTELTSKIRLLERYLERLNLGVSAWYTIASHRYEENDFRWSRDLGYTFHRNKWRIALRETWDSPEDGEHGETTHTFDEAPRWMAIEAVSKLPDLIDGLLERTQETTKKLKNRSIQAQELADAIQEALSQTTDANVKGGE